jgi:hypothetical protein
MSVQRVWLQVALAAGAGLVPVVVCCSALLAIARFIIAWTSSQSPGGYYSAPPPPSTTLLVFIVATVILGLVSFSLPPLALGARGGHALIIAVLYSLGFGALVLGVFVIVFIPSQSLEVVYPLAFLAWVGPSLLGSLIAVQGEGRMVSRILPATLIVAALAIYCASVLAFRLSGGGDRGLSFAPLVVAASSWVVLPAIVASLRSD